MCGLIGSVGYENFDVSKLLTSIEHRGPDSNGYFQEKMLFLGHTRLSILDISVHGAQPMQDKSGRYVIIFNGEIYNHLEIREKLESKYEFISKSDTETLLYGFIEFGDEILNMLNGIFAFAIYDRLQGELFIARDHFGVKPLYYYAKGSKLIFGSEIKSFFGFNEFDKSIDYESLVNYLTLLWSPGEKTAFSNVKKLLPGHFMRINLFDFTGPAIKKYYEIPFKGIYSKKSEEELIDQLDEKLFNAVKRQLLSDLPVAFFLSGGVDSSAIVAFAKKVHPNKRLRCYTINTSNGEDGAFNEDLHYARVVAKYLDVDLVEVDSKVDIVANFDKMIYHLDEPQSDAAPLHVLNICNQAKKDGFKVLLGGTGGDDVFSGYRRHQALRYEAYINSIPLFLREFTKWIFLKFNLNNSWIRRVKKVTSNLHETKINRVYGYFEWLPLNIVKGLFHSDLKGVVEKYNPRRFFIDLLSNISSTENDLNKSLFWELKTFLVDHNLNYTDKLGMATGVEIRVPFLDKELVEFSTTIPPSLKMKGSSTKYILKKLMERYLPYEVIYRSKAGFGAPVRDWVIHNLDEKIDTYLGEKSIKKRGIFDAAKIQELIKLNKKGKIDASYSIWGLLAIESWMRTFVDDNARI